MCKWLDSETRFKSRRQTRLLESVDRQQNVERRDLRVLLELCVCVHACARTHSITVSARCITRRLDLFGASRKPRCPRDAVCVVWRSAGCSRRAGTSAPRARKFSPNRGCQERRRYLQLLPTPRGGYLKKREAWTLKLKLGVFDATHWTWLSSAL